MQYLRLYEDMKRKPKVDDWVIDIQGKVGVIYKVKGDLYFIRYNDNSYDNYIAYFSELYKIGTKEEIELELSTRKFNL